MKLKINIPGTIFLVGVIVTWELIGRSEIINPPAFLPPFSQILSTLIELIGSGELVAHVFLTTQRSLVGLTIAGLIALPVGLAMGYFRRAHDLFSPSIELLRPIPPAAVIPVAILFLGIHTEMKIAVVVFGCMWPILINTIDGVKNLDPVLIDTGKMLSLKGPKFFYEIVLKGSSPYIVTGFRISLAISLILTVVTEMIAGNDGLGFFIMLSERSFEIKEMYAGLFAAGLLGFCANKGFVVLTDRFLLRWYRGYTAKV